MPDAPNNPAYGRSPHYGRVFSISPGEGRPICDRLLCHRTPLVALNCNEAEAQDNQPAAEPALLAQLKYVMSAFEDIGDGRQVSVGPDGPGEYAVHFENQGRTTKLTLCGEATEAFHRLHLRVVARRQR